MAPVGVSVGTLDPVHPLVRAAALAFYGAKHTRAAMIRLTDFATVSNASTREAVQPALRKLESLAELEPNWDSYGALPPSPQAIDTARQLLEAVAEAFGDAAGDRVRPYAVAPLADGGVQLEWRSPLYDVEVEIGRDGELGYLFVEREGTEEKLTEGDDVSLARTLGLVARVLIP